MRVLHIMDVRIKANRTECGVLKPYWEIAWQRFSLNSSIVADGNGRFITTVFYFTILVPFGLLSSLFMDPLRVRRGDPAWHAREAVPSDLDSAREQS